MASNVCLEPVSAAKQHFNEELYNANELNRRLDELKNRAGEILPDMIDIGKSNGSVI